MAKKDLDVAKASRKAELDMANYNREIAEMIKSGEYFRDALRWYDEKYHAPIIEKAYSVAVTAIAVVCTWFAVVGFMRFLPVEETVTLAIGVDASDTKYYTVQKLTDRIFNTNQVLLKYLVNEYVIRREGYSIQSLEGDVKRLKVLSTPELFQAYRSYINPANPESPITRFERHTRRSITIKRVQYPGFEEGFDAELLVPKKAVIYFTATEISPGKTQTTDWKATVEFAYQPVRVNQENFAVTPMEFVVTSYTVAPHQKP